MFKKYDSIEDYNADTLAPDEKRVSLIMDRDYVVDVKYDAPMREVTLPAVGDALFIDANGGKHFYRDAKPNIVPGLTLVGFVFKVNGNKVKILGKNRAWVSWLACWQYAITKISSTNISIGLRMSGNNATTGHSASYNSYTTVDIELDNTNIDANNAVKISNKIAEKAADVGDTRAWWAWYDEANNRIVVQTDTNNDTNQQNVTGTNCTIALCVYDNLPANNVVLLNNNYTSNGGIMNVVKALSYYSTNGSSPSSNVSIGSTAVVNLSSYKTSSYCSALRAKYGEGNEGYKNYIRAKRIKYPQQYGAFILPSGIEVARLYGNATAPTKTETTKWKFPVLHYGATINYESEGLNIGNWHTADLVDGMEYMDEEVYPKIIDAQSRMRVDSIAANHQFSQITSNVNMWTYNNNIGGLSQAALYNYSGSWAYVVCELTLSFPSNNQNS